MGGSIAPGFVLQATQIDDIGVLKTLENFDVNWHFELQGVNAIQVALANNVGQDNIDFLLARGVSKKQILMSYHLQ